jgi:hypothetical protein
MERGIDHRKKDGFAIPWRTRKNAPGGNQLHFNANTEAFATGRSGPSSINILSGI